MKQNYFSEEDKFWMTDGRTVEKDDRITPTVINVLGENEIFVFGSNIQGAHMGGAARVAYNKFGAEWGNGEGLQGKSYALPTMEGLSNTKNAHRRARDAMRRMSYKRRKGKGNRNVRLRLSARQQHETTYKEGERGKERRRSSELSI